MNIFNKITLQSMEKSRTRTLVTVIGVILSAAMITAVATFSVSLLNYMINGSIVKYGNWHVAFSDVDSSFIKERTHEDGVAATATFENIGYATLKGGKNPYKPYLFIAGFSEEAFEILPIDLVSGRLPENAEEVLIPAHVAANGGVKFEVGDTLSLAVGKRMEGNRKLEQLDPYISGEEPEAPRETLLPVTEKTYTIVGICQRPGFEEPSAPGYTVITAADPQQSADSFSAFITLAHPRQVRTYAKNVAENHSYVFNDNVLRFMGLSGDGLFNALLYSVGCILIALIMIGSVFLIHNSFTISLNERTRQFGILSSVGATERQLRNSVLFEGLCIGATGIPIGVLIGLGSIRIVISFVAGNFSNFAYSAVPLTLTVSIPTIVLAAAVSMVTILISAYIPACKAAGRPVMESIRQTNAIKLESNAVKTSKLAERIFGLPGTLALKNFKRNKKRYRSIVLSLTLSVVLFVSANAFGSTLKQGAQRSVVDTDYDIIFTTQNMEEDELFWLYEKLRTAEGVYASSYQTMMAYSCTVPAAVFSERYRQYAACDLPEETVDLPMDIQLIPDSEYLRFVEELNLPPEEYTGQNAKVIAVAKQKPGTETGQSQPYDMFADLSMDLTIAPQTGSGPNREEAQNISITFVDTIPFDLLPENPSEVKPYVFIVVAPYQLKEKFEFPDIQVKMGLSFLSENASQSTAEMEMIIQGSGVTSAYSLYNMNKMLEENRSILFVVNVFTYVFVIMISLIAVANVFNTISTNINLRRRELAMVRSVGMSDHDFNKMMNFECAFFGIKALLLGCPTAAAASWLICKGLMIGGADISFRFPWGSMAISMFSVFFIVFVTMLYAVNKIKKENIIEALRDDLA